MLVGLVALVLAIIGVALVPVVMMMTLYRLVDYLSDEDKLEEVRRARREGRPVDFSGIGGDEQPSADPGESRGDRRCPSCGEENEADFDRCWNCQTAL